MFCLSSCHHKESVASFHYNDELIGIGLADNYQMSKLSKIDLSNLQVGSIAAYSDFFSDVKYIPLELTEMSMLGEIRNLQITNNGDFIVFDVIVGNIELLFCGCIIAMDIFIEFL